PVTSRSSQIEGTQATLADLTATDAATEVQAILDVRERDRQRTTELGQYTADASTGMGSTRR
ncbi:MAG: hypothetical protein EA388_15740, partial [Nitriliruptor sp.]